jgi:hypothetical protein
MAATVTIKPYGIGVQKLLNVQLSVLHRERAAVVSSSSVGQPTKGRKGEKHGGGLCDGAV